MRRPAGKTAYDGHRDRSRYRVAVGISAAAIDDAIYRRLPAANLQHLHALNQYHVVLEVKPDTAAVWTLSRLYVPGTTVTGPLQAFVIQNASAPLTVNPCH